MLRIYSFRTQFLSSAFAASPEDIELDQDIDLIRGNYKKLIFPITFKQFSGKKFTDVMPTGYPALYLISDKLKKTLEDNHLTGWQSYPIILLDKNGQEITGYHGFSIIGSCSPPDYSQSRIIETKYVEHGPIVHHYVGYKVVPFDSCDFFIPESTIGFYVNEKAANVLKANKITNLELTDISEGEVRCKTVNRNFKI